MTEIVFNEDLVGVQVSIALAHRPGTPDARFDEVQIKDITITLGQPVALPGGQGLMWHLGYFQPGRQLPLRWSFSTQDADNLEYLVGIIPNGRLTKMVRLKDYRVESYETYGDKVMAIIPAG